jgi:hypothetical protein
MNNQKSGGEIVCKQAIVYGESEGRKVTIFLDTGSAVSMVSLSLIDKLGLRGRIEPCKLKLRAFGKTEIKHLGEIKMILKVAGVEVNSKFVISDQLDNNFLLGFPDMAKNKLEIKPAEGIFKSPKEAVEFISTPQNIKRSYEVKCKKNYYNP